VREWISRPPSWLNVTAVEPGQLQPITQDLDLGERSAIALAVALQADLVLIDEAAGRAEAKRRKLRVTGTLGVLGAGAEQGLVDVPDVVRRLQETSFYADESLLNAISGRWLKT
jgi:predicted nucleic acid-binding protein